MVQASVLTLMLLDVLIKRAGEPVNAAMQIVNPAGLVLQITGLSFFCILRSDADKISHPVAITVNPSSISCRRRRHTSVVHSAGEAHGPHAAITSTRSSMSTTLFGIDVAGRGCGGVGGQLGRRSTGDDHVAAAANAGAASADDFPVGLQLHARSRCRPIVDHLAVAAEFASGVPSGR